MKNGKFANAPSPRRKTLIIVLSIILVVCIGAGATLAFFANSTGPIINTFQSGSAGAEIEETLSGNTKTEIKVHNTGKTPVYVRVRLVSYFEDASGNVLPQDSPVVGFTSGDNWNYMDGYYYYKLPVGAGGFTSDLLGTDVTMSAGQVIEVLADTVQATPASAVQEVWGVSADWIEG